LSWC